MSLPYRPDSFLLKLSILWVHLTNIVQAPPSLGLSILYGARYQLTGQYQATDDSWSPLGLTLTWCWVVPRHSMEWFYLFPYKRLRRSTSEISKLNVLGYYRNLDSLRYGTSTAFLVVLWAARLSRFPRSDRLHSQAPLLFWRAMAGCIAIGLHTAAEPLVSFLVLHEPMYMQLHCVLKKGFCWRGNNDFFPYKHLWRVIRSISQGTEVMIVTEYVCTV